MMKTFISFIYCLIAIMSLSFASSTLANVYTVTDPGDSNAASVCDGIVVCTLRQAIMDANSNPGPNIIQFNINNHSLGPFSIKVSAALGPLPVINNPITIDGFTQAGPDVHAIELSGELLPVCQTAGCPFDKISPRTASSSGYAAGLLLVSRDRALGSTATDGACLDGSTTPGCTLAQNSNGSTIRGLVINKFPRQAIYLYGVDNTTIVGNYFGLDTSGTLAGYQNGRLLAGISTPHHTVLIEAGNNNYIGTTAADYANNTIQSINRNVFGAANLTSLRFNQMNGGGTRGFAGCATCSPLTLGYSNNVIQGNYFGTDASGSCIIGGIGNTKNATYAPLLCSASANNPARSLASNVTAIFMTGLAGLDLGNDNVIGGLIPGQGNVFVASDTNIISLKGKNTKMMGNIIGRDAIGTNDLLGSLNGDALTILDTTNLVLNKNIVAASTFNGGANTAAITFTGFGPNDIITNDNVTFVNNQVIGNLHNGIYTQAINGKLGFDVQNGQIIPMPNVIANNKGTGIFIQQGPFLTPTPHVAILYNSIYGNNTAAAPGLLGIDLIQTTALPIISKEGPNINVPPNANTGPNNLQNFPLLSANRSFINPALVQVWGSLNSAPNSIYLIQAFSNDSAVCLQLNITPVLGYQPSPGCTLDSGFNTSFLESQGHVFIGQALVTTDTTGHVDFHFPANVDIPIGSILTATATLIQKMPDGSFMPTDTSEFSQAINVDKVGSANAYLHANSAAGNDNNTLGPCDDPNSWESISGECSYE